MRDKTKTYYSGDFDVKVEVYGKNDTPNAFGERVGYVLLGWDWANLMYLETLKDNEAETQNAHDSAYNIARLTFRQNTLKHDPTHRYKLKGMYYEAVGVPTYRNRDVVYVNVRTRDDINALVN